MTTAHASVVVGHCNEVVDGRSVAFVDDVLGHVKAVDGEINKSVQFVAPITIVTETFQRNDEEPG